jgi:hypothetical protein
MDYQRSIDGLVLEITNAYFYDGHEVQKMSRVVCSTSVLKREMNVRCWNRSIRPLSRPRGLSLASACGAE